MTQISVTITKRHQITLPAEIRDELGLEAGCRLLMQVRAGTIVLVPLQGSLVEQLRGLHSGIWRIDVDRYLEEERDSWSDETTL